MSQPLIATKRSRRFSCAALAWAALASGCVYGPGNYSWYCDQLNAKPSTWSVTLTASGTCASVPSIQSLQFDAAGQSQSCGDGCACTLSTWAYETVGSGGEVGARHLNAPAQESCNAQIQCAMSGSSVSGSLEIPDWPNTESISLGGVMSDGAQCQIALAGAPE